MSKNTLSYPGNGEFQVVSATEVDEVQATAAVATAGDGCINVCAAAGATVTVFALDGSTVYRGTATSIPVANGLYIVTVAAPGVASEAVKVLVK